MNLAITPMAREQVMAAIAEEDRDDLRLRVAIVGKGPSGFQYSLDLVAPEEHPDDDIAVPLDEFSVVVDRESAEKLEGVTVDFITRLQESGFKFVNPNSMWSDPMAEAVQQVISDKINPSIAAHGGFITLLDVKDGGRSGLLFFHFPRFSLPARVPVLLHKTVYLFFPFSYLGCVVPCPGPRATAAGGVF